MKVKSPCEGIKTKEDAIARLVELEAYRRLEGVSFDFGTGLIKNELSFGTEEAYWKIEVLFLRDLIEDWLENTKYPPKVNHKRRLNRHARKRVGKRKILKLAKVADWAVGYNDGETRYRRFYISGSRKYAKWRTNHVVRNNTSFPLIGNGYRKCFGYWDVIF